MKGTIGVFRLSLFKESLKTPIVPFTQAIKKNIPVWVTEISEIDALDASMSDGLQWANTFHNYLVDASVNAFIWWAGAMPTGNNESLIVLNKDRTNYTITKRYDTFGNYTRYIKPRSQRIETKLSSKTDSLLVSAYKKDKEYTVVVINNSKTALVTSLQIDGKKANGKLNGYLTDEKNRWTPCEYTMTKEKQYIVEIPAKCIITFTGTL